MKRRQFIAGLGSAAAWPVVARAKGGFSAYAVDTRADPGSPRR